jgi:thiamine-phosphate pyrophosphorylase
MPNKIGFRFLLLTDRKQTKKPLINIIENACKAGLKAVQLREKDLSSRDLLQLAKQIRNITKRFNSKLLINDRLDIALLSKADGLHSPENGTPLKYSRQFGKHLLIGRSVHSLNGALDAEKECYDYIIFGPVYRTASKTAYGKPKGISELKKVCEAVKVPVFAVGGITPERASRCVGAGSHGVAVIGSVMKSANPKGSIIRFKKAMGEL